VAVGDFNGDGNEDLAVATREGEVWTFLGNGDGTFRSGRRWQVGSFLSDPLSVTAVDLEGNGILDLVTLIPGDNTVSVLLGYGNGSFRPAVTYAIGPNAKSLAVADFNGDGIPDLAVTIYGTFNQPASYVSVLRGNGDGTFQAPVDYDAGPREFAVAAGDFNGDGKTDLAVSNYAEGTVNVLLGRGDGTFEAPVSYPVGIYPGSIAVADFNGDGIPDLVVANNGSTPANGSISLLLGRGDGTFQPALSYDAGPNPSGVVVGDFNGDGAPDLAVPNATTSGTVTVLLNAADWNGSRPMVPKHAHAPAVQPPVSRPPQRDPVSVFGAAHDPQAQGQLASTSNVLPPGRQSSWPPPIDQDRQPRSEARSTPTFLITTRRAQEIVLVDWTDLLTDKLAAPPSQPSL
jgi:hypothetical protein